MKNSIGIGLAIAATTSFAFAGGGEGEGEKKAKKVTNNETLSKMAATQGGGGATMSAAPGSGVTISAGDDFSLNISNRVQVLWRYSSFEFAQSINNFSLPRVRTVLEGHVWDDSKTYRVQMDWAANSSNFANGVDGGILLDAWFNWDFWENESGDGSIGIRVGQQKPHHGREFQGWDTHLENTARSLASRTFTGFRVVGAFLHGTHLEGGKLHWWAGAANSDPAGGSASFNGGANGAASIDQRTNFMFDVRLDPWGDYGDETFEQGALEHAEDLAGTIGASLLVGNHMTAPATPNIETTSVNVYAGIKAGGIHALGEVFLRSDDPQGAGATETDSTGYAIGASYTLPEREEGGNQWSLAARWSSINLDTPAPQALMTGTALGGGSGDINEINATVSNYYHKHNMKTQVAYTVQTVSPDGGVDADNHFLDVMFTWMF